MGAVSYFRSAVSYHAMPLLITRRIGVNSNARAIGTYPYEVRWKLFPKIEIGTRRTKCDAIQKCKGHKAIFSMRMFWNYIRCCFQIYAGHLRDRVYLVA